MEGSDKQGGVARQNNHVFQHGPRCDGTKAYLAMGKKKMHRLLWG